MATRTAPRAPAPASSTPHGLEAGGEGAEGGTETDPPHEGAPVFTDDVRPRPHARGSLPATTDRPLGRSPVLRPRGAQDGGDPTGGRAADGVRAGGRSEAPRIPGMPRTPPWTALTGDLGGPGPLRTFPSSAALGGGTPPMGSARSGGSPERPSRVRGCPPDAAPRGPTTPLRPEGRARQGGVATGAEGPSLTRLRAGGVPIDGVGSGPRRVSGHAGESLRGPLAGPKAVQGRTRDAGPRRGTRAAPRRRGTRTPRAARRARGVHFKDASARRRGEGALAPFRAPLALRARPGPKGRRAKGGGPFPAWGGPVLRQGVRGGEMKPGDCTRRTRRCRVLSPILTAQRVLMFLQLLGWFRWLGLSGKGAVGAITCPSPPVAQARFVARGEGPGSPP